MTAAVGGASLRAGGAIRESEIMCDERTEADTQDYLATELTKIITFQRGYQANARVITVTDQIMQETMNLRQ